MSNSTNSEIINSLVGLYKFPYANFKPYFRTNVCAVSRSGIIEQLLNTFNLDVEAVDFIRLQVAIADQTFVKKMKAYNVKDYRGYVHPFIVVGVMANKKKLYRWFKQNRNRFILKSNDWKRRVSVR